jgi:hypothetical protein
MPKQERKRSPTLVEFVIANGAAVAFPMALFLSREPRLLAAGVVSVAVVIPVTYRPMLACPGRWSRAALLLLLTLVSLLGMGTLLSWEAQVGDSPAGSWSARVDGGFILALAGFIPALFTAFPLLLLANSLLTWPKASAERPRR